MDILQEKIKQFTEKQMSSGTPKEQVDQGLLLLFGGALKQTFEETKLTEDKELFSKLKEGVSDIQQLLDDSLLQQKADLVVNDKGETFKDVFSRNFTSILDEFEQQPQ